MSVVTSLLSWAENRFIVCSQLINLLTITSLSWKSAMSADTTLNSSEELCGQLTLLDKLINWFAKITQLFAVRLEKVSGLGKGPEGARRCKYSLRGGNLRKRGE